MENKDKDMDYKFFPWDRGEKPYFVNEEGFEWYIDKDCTEWAKRDMANGNKGLKNVGCFFVKKGDDVHRVLINDKQQILHSATSMEGMCVKIDMLKMIADE